MRAFSDSTPMLEWNGLKLMWVSEKTGVRHCIYFFLFKFYFLFFYSTGTMGILCKYPLKDMYVFSWTSTYFCYIFKYIFIVINTLSLHCYIWRGQYNAITPAVPLFQWWERVQFEVGMPLFQSWEKGPIRGRNAPLSAVREGSNSQ